MKVKLSGAQPGSFLAQSIFRFFMLYALLFQACSRAAEASSDDAGRCLSGLSGNECLGLDALPSFVVNIEKVYREFLANDLPSVKEKRLLVDPYLPENISPLKEVEAFAKKIAQLVSQLRLHPDLMTRLISSGLKFSICPPFEALNPGSSAQMRYFPSHHQILVPYSNRPFTDYPSMFRNELNHAAIAATNFRRLVRPMNLASNVNSDVMETYVQLDGDGRLDVDVTVKLQKIKKEFNSKVKRFADIRKKWKRERKTLSQADKDFYKKIKRLVVKTYNPYTEGGRLPENQLVRLLQQDDVLKYSDDSYRVPKEYLRRPHDLRIFPSAKPSRLNSHGFNHAIFYYHYTYPDKKGSIVRGFLHNFENLNRLYGREAMQGGYGHLSEDQQLLEYMSHIDGFSASIKKELAPSFCDFFTKFHELPASSSYCYT